MWPPVMTCLLVDPVGDLLVGEHTCSILPGAAPVRAQEAFSTLTTPLLIPSLILSISFQRVRPRERSR